MLLLLSAPVCQGYLGELSLFLDLRSLARSLVSSLARACLLSPVGGAEGYQVWRVKWIRVYLQPYVWTRPINLHPDI